MLNWNEIRTNAARFAEEWQDAAEENAEAQSFWNEFLQVYGIKRRRVASFERKVKGLDKGSGRGRIDLLWPGTFMAEHKSKGRDLADALQQALAYRDVLEEHERPQFIAVSDFSNIHLFDVEQGETRVIDLAELPNRVEEFSFLIGKQLRHQRESDPVNVKAAQEMGKLHNLLEDGGYTGHALELLLVRLLFLLFGDDTGLWDERGLFYDLLADHTRSDGQDVGAVLAQLFQLLDTPPDKRPKSIPPHLSGFPYVNGELFAERIDLAFFSPKMRELLLGACQLDWGQVSPAIFGSMFQSVMDPTERRNLGAHYTSEENILKALGPLFLDDLKAELAAAGNNKRKLEAFLEKLPRIRVLDPACGSGNFLILAYRELRRLELEALVRLLADKSGAIQGVTDLNLRLKVNVGQFYGIEYDEFPSQIARVAMWLTDHQMNIEASRKLGQNIIRLPLTKAAHILHGDALEADWAEHLQLEQDTEGLTALYIVGNPPFVGYNQMSEPQHDQIKRLFSGVKGAGRLDFVSGWYALAGALLREVKREFPHLQAGAALVSTNSVTQGEQVAPIWHKVLDEQGNRIQFAHQTFQWMNEAPGRAAVHCVIVGFAQGEPTNPRLFSYPDIRGTAVEQAVGRINAYLVDGPHVIIPRIKSPLRPWVPEIHFGHMPRDGGYLILHSRQEYEEFVASEPGAKPFIRPLLDGQDFLNGGMRWCLWLKDVAPGELRKLPRVLERINKVREFRLASKAASTRKFGEIPAIFAQLAPDTTAEFLVVPRVSSERREYIPIGYLDANTIVNDLLYMIPNASLFLFGLIQSRTHMDWMRTFAGRLKSDFRYAKDNVYNSFPWPDRSSLKPAQIKAVEDAAQKVLDTRAKYEGSTLADLYDPNVMPADLRAAHRQLDQAVERIYGIKADATGPQRLARLLELYQELAPTLESQTKAKKTRKTRTPTA